VVYGLKQCRQYLLGRKFVVRTDHAALSWLRRKPEPMPQLARWLTFIEEFSFDVQHRVGTKHQNVDSLSRKPIRDEASLETEHQELRISAVTQQEDVDKPVGDPLAGENFAAEQFSDPDIGPVLRLKLSCETKPHIKALISESEATKVYWSQWDQLTIHNGVLCRRFYGKGSQSNVLQMIVPATLRSEAMKRCHAGIVGGHLGAKKTAFQVGRRFYWHHWQSDVKRFCRQCVVCGSYHRGKLPRTAPLQPIEAGAPFERLRYAYRAVKSHLGRAANRAKRHYDLRVKRSRYESGEWVSYYNPRRFRGREDKWSRKFSGPFLVIDVLPPVNLKLQRSPGSKPLIVHYDRVKSWEGEVPKPWLRNVPEHKEFVMLSPLPSLDIEASMATEPSEELPVTADATRSKRESEAGNETGYVPDID